MLFTVAGLLELLVFAHRLHFVLAFHRYTEALEVCPDKSMLHKLYSNRSMAYMKASRYAEALKDAEEALCLAPTWDKAHYRKGSALQCLKQYAQAASSFQSAWHLSKGEVRLHISRAFDSLNASGLADVILIGNPDTGGYNHES